VKRSISLISLIFILFISCEVSQDSTETILEGTVYYLDDNSVYVPLQDATVYSKSTFAQATTSSNGVYQLVFDALETEEMKIDIVASKVGFDASEASVFAKEGETILVPDITLVKQGSDTTISPIDTVSSSGNGAHIEVSGTPKSHIYIQSSGLSETAAINFLVTDARGIPVDDDHVVSVSFSILNGPDGGEYLFPETMDSQDGYVYTVLNSGILAGTVQLEARFEVDGQTIRAIPIRVVIFGGLPDEEHFSIALEKVNIAGQVHFGLLDQVTAFVGDKFSNPVAPGTAVYFYSDYGIVYGSAVTDYLGRATVEFMSAEPLPPNPAINPYVYITAQTHTDTLVQNTIYTNTRLLLSSATAPIQVAPSGFTYNDLNVPLKFDYVVEDIYGYPLVGDTQILVDATDGSLYGDVSIQLNDTQSSGPGNTEFSFTWAPGDSLEAPQVFISITVDPPSDGNGYQSTSVSGSKTN